MDTPWSYLRGGLLRRLKLRPRFFRCLALFRLAGLLRRLLRLLRGTRGTHGDENSGEGGLCTRQEGVGMGVVFERVRHVCVYVGVCVCKSISDLACARHMNSFKGGTKKITKKR